MRFGNKKQDYGGAHLFYREMHSRAVYRVGSQASEFLHQSQQISWLTVFVDNNQSFCYTQPKQSKLSNHEDLKTQ